MVLSLVLRKEDTASLSSSGRVPSSVHFSVPPTVVRWSSDHCSFLRFRFTKMKTATNIYIFNLALADTLCLMTLPFQGTDTFLGFWPFGNVLCKIAISIDYYNMFTSTFTLTMMSVDRYIAICHPIKALDIRTPHKAKVVNVCIWALASVFGIPAMVMGSAENENNGQYKCIQLVGGGSSGQENPWAGGAVGERHRFRQCGELSAVKPT